MQQIQHNAPSQPLPQSLKAASDWFQLIPFGTFSHPNGIQHFQRPEANEIVHHFYSLGARISRFFRGVPITLRNKICGHILGLEARDHGLWVLVKWAKPGENYFKRKIPVSLTPFWLLRSEEFSNLHKVFTPCKLLGVEFSKDPALTIKKLRKSSLTLTLNTKSLTANLLGLTYPNKNNHDRFLSLVHNHMTKTGHHYLKSWNIIKKQNPDLFQSF